MEFHITPNVDVRRDADGNVTSLSHLQQPYALDSGMAIPSAKALAAQYIRDVADIYEIEDKLLSKLNSPVGPRMTDEGTSLRIAQEKRIGETTVAAYVETHFGLPIWEAGLNVMVHGPDHRVTSSQSTLHRDIKITKPDMKKGLAKGDVGITEILKATKIKKRPAKSKVISKRLLIYRYDPDLRFDPELQQQRKPQPLAGRPPTLELPPVSRKIRPKRHYVVLEVIFVLPTRGYGDLEWRAFLEIESGSILYLRAAVCSAFGNIFTFDPVTSSGNAANMPDAGAAALDALTTVVTLRGLTAGDPQPLTGEFVDIQDTNSPSIAPPTEANPPGNFSYSAVTDKFTSVNAYHHMDALYQMVKDFGFDPSTYFPGTTFPIPVDHRGEGGGVNAHHYGSSGTTKYTYGLAQSGAPVGIAADSRVVIHEFGHSVLSNNIGGGTFSWAHGVGDSMAAILADPGSNAPDRFLTFPWISILTGRRHDRDIASGWAWGGSQDTGGYISTQILSTTLFRAYRSLGGDSAHPSITVRLARQRFAASFMTYLIIKAVGMMTSTSPPTGPEALATALRDGDTDTPVFLGHPGGAFHKVIRWAFEKQGLYQPTGAPTPVTTEGDPPDIDVYIDDGRNGEYEYKWNFWQNQNVWNRLSADGGLTHETPITRQTNYLYVRVQNRGTQPANKVVVKAYHCKPATGLVWPDDWKATTTAQLPVSGSIPSGGEAIVGPFEWTPEVIGHECLLAVASAVGDISNADPISGLPSAAGPIAHWRLVPFDNNIGQRNVAPVAGGGGAFNLLESFRNRRLWVQNPYELPSRIKLEVTLPDFLRRRKWDLKLTSPGGGAFTLGARDSREVTMILEKGSEFTPADVKAAGRDAVINIVTLIDDQVVGGMTYAIDPNLTKPPIEVGRGDHKADCTEIAEDLLDCLGVRSKDVKCVRVKRVTVDIDIHGDCDC